jgi:acyl-CoA thioester hydrolase
MFDFTTQIRVRYADTDQMGYVYYGNYATFFEIGRVEALRSVGISYKKLEEAGVMMPVLENYSKYVKPALYDDLLNVRVMVKEMPGTRIRFDYEITNESGVLLHVGYTVLVFISAETKRVVAFPKEIKKVLERFFEKSLQ